MNDFFQTGSLFEQFNEFYQTLNLSEGLPEWFSGKESAYQCRRCKNVVLTPGSERFPREENGNPLQYSCLGNPLDREAWWAAVHRGHKESDITE